MKKYASLVTKSGRARKRGTDGTLLSGHLTYLRELESPACCSTSSDLRYGGA